MLRFDSFSLEGEIWKQVPSLPDVFVSNLGRVKLPNSFSVMPKGNVRIYITKPTYGSIHKSKKDAKHKYYRIQNRKIGSFKVHRLVCEAFYGQAPNEDSVVIHLDENALNNRVENLKWGTQKENLNCPKFLEYCRSRIGDSSPVRKAKIKGAKAP